MNDGLDMLIALSDALAARTISMRASVAAISIAEDRYRTGMLWQPDLVVASEQALPERDEFELAIAGEPRVTAALVGRDRGSNIALLRLAHVVPFQPLTEALPVAGSLAFAFGADGAGGATVRMGVVNRVGPEWHSSAGGRIDARIVLDTRLAHAEEGGPVLDAAGRCVGFTTLGASGEVLIIPFATIHRIAAALMKDGHVARGWLGIALQPVAVPDALHEQAGQSSGMMVMSISDQGPAAKAGVVAGDIVLSVNGSPARRFRAIAKQLGSESVGRAVDLRVIRGGDIVTLNLTVEARPKA